MQRRCTRRPTRCCGAFANCVRRRATSRSPWSRWRAARGAIELIVGAYEDAQFGPVIVFGHGGTAVEVRADTALGLPPLNLTLAHDMFVAHARVQAA